ncbi:MAG: response regulator [Candidatus Flexifilum sp.]|jgi:CheY-like chemotaxis protein
MSSDRPCIVVVDDNFDDLQIIYMALSYYSLEVHAASSAEQCADLVNQVQPDLVITDLAMPEADGWAVLDMLRSNPQTAHTPVVAITAYHSPRLQQEALARGFNGYVAKPIEMDTIMNELRRVLYG